MTNQTTGQRIASRRKLLNLSQEALSEQLEVSRQAVSKWESDTALPDIDKLIALSKIFGVSVGWLLGTEKDPTFDPSTGLSDAQLKMVEEIVTRYQPAPRRFRWAAPVLTACVLAAAILFGIHCQTQIEALSAENTDTHAEISALAEGNQDIQSRIDSMSSLIAQQVEEGKILSNYSVLPSFSKDLQSVQVDFYLVPKIFQENATAYLSIINPAAGVKELLECTVLGSSCYWVQADLPPADGYKYSFLLVTDSGYQEQVLSTGEGSYFSDLYSGTRFHSKAETRTTWNRKDTLYTFTAPVYPPLIPISAGGFVGYEDVLITLRHNGEAIWEQSFRDAFRELGGAQMWSEEPLVPDIQVQLPELTAGDTLTLEVTTHYYGQQVLDTYYGGQTLTAVLETLEVIE